MSQITQKGATGFLSLQAGGTFQSSTDVNAATLVGTRYDLSDGREVIFVSVGATAISTAGLLCQDPAIVANHQGLVLTTYTAYSASTNTPASAAVTLGATALNQNQYQGGFAFIDSGPGIGQSIRIATNPAAASSATNVTIVFEDGLNTALTTSSTICLLPAHGNAVVVNPTTVTGAPVGVTLYPLSSGTVGIPGTSYGFLQSKGIVSCLSDASAPAVGSAISPSVTTVGSIMQATGSTAIIGFANQAAVSAKARSVFINL